MIHGYFKGKIKASTCDAMLARHWMSSFETKDPMPSYTWTSPFAMENRRRRESGDQQTPERAVPFNSLPQILKVFCGMY